MGGDFFSANCAIKLGDYSTLAPRALAKRLGRAKAMAVVRGDAEVYLHSGGQHEWDSCAPVAVALVE